MLLLAIGSHLFQPLRIRRPNEVRLHVINPPLRVHQVLVILPLNLYHAHDHAINHVDRLSFIILTFAFAARGISLFNVFDTLPVNAVFLPVVGTVLDRLASLVDKVIVTKLLLHVVLIVLLSSTS